MRPPRTLQELNLRAKSTEETLRGQLGREPTDDEIAAALEVPVEDVTEMRQSAAAYRASSLDQPGESGTPVGERFLVAADPVDDLVTRVDLHRALAALSDRERSVVSMRFVDDMTQKEIGERIGVSQMQVSRILSAVCARLRDELLAEAS